VRRASTILRRLAAPGEPVRLGTLNEAFGDGAIALALLLFGLLTLLALIPGTSVITGAPIVAVALQLVGGRRTLWLPEKLQDRHVPVGVLNLLNPRIIPHLRRVERLFLPRPPNVFGPFGMRVIGAFCLVMGVLIVSPIPLGNLAPGVAVAVIGLAMFRKDGLAAIAGFIIGIGALVFLVIVYGGLIAIFIHWVGHLFHHPPPVPPGPAPGPAP
jgi:hypothetical protein